MKGVSRKRKGAIARLGHLLTGKAKREVKRVISLALTVSMVLSGFPSIPMSLASADDTIQDFEISSEDLKYAMEKAVHGGTPISESAYTFAGEESEIYDELFYWNDIYELTDDVEIDTDGNLALKIFMREDGEQDLDSYRFTGEENLIFLILNGTNKERVARIYIDGVATDLIKVAAKNGVSMEKAEEEEILEETAEAVEEPEMPVEEAIEPETQQVVMPAPGEGPASGGPGGAGSGAGAPPEWTEPEDDGIPVIDTPFEDAMGEVGPGVVGPGAGKEQGPGQAPDSDDADPDASGDDESSDTTDDGSDASGSYDDGNTGSDAGHEHGGNSGSDAGSESGDSGSDSGSTADTGSSESSSDNGSASDGGDSGSSGSSDSGSASSDSGSSDSGSSSDGGSSDSGSSSSSGSSDSGSSSSSGSSDSGSSSGSDSSDGGSSSGGSSDSSSSDGDSGSMSASISAHGIGILTASLDEFAAGSDESESTVSILPDIVIESQDASGADGEYVVETEVRLASASDIYSYDDDDDDTEDNYQKLDGDIYKSVLVNKKRAAAAFVTTVEALGLRMSDVDRRTPVELEEQTINAEIYRDSDYNWKFADGTSIILSGMMPVDAVAKAYPVEVEIEDIHVLAAYDITIFDEDGYEYQPEDYEIEVEIENDEISEALDLEHELTVFHMEDEDDEPEEIAVIEPTPKMKKVNFFAEKFSIYVVGDDQQLYEPDLKTPHYVYNVTFYADLNNDGVYETLSTQTLSAGEYVEEPGVPDKEDYIFKGWFTKDGTQYDFSDNNTLPEINKDVELDLYAQYEELHYVHYMIHAHTSGDKETNAVFHTEAYTVDEKLDTSTAEGMYTPYLESGIDPVTGNTVTTQAVTGWNDADNKEWATGYTIDWSSINGDLELYPQVENAYWIYFDMNGQHSIEDPEPQYVLATSETVGSLPNVVVSGYSLDGWYTAAENGNKVTSETTLSSLGLGGDNGTRSLTLYAHWSESSVAYTINIWRQKAIDGKAGIDSKTIADNESYEEYIQYYDYAESHYVEASQSDLKTGDIPTSDRIYGWTDYTAYETITNENSSYYGYEYSYTTAETRTLNDLSTKIMAADGSTVINIFYNRVTITWTFEESSSGIPGGSSTGAETGTLIGLYGTNVEQGTDKSGTLSGWPNAGETTTTIYRWYTGSGSSTTEYAYETEFIIISLTDQTTSVISYETEVTFYNRIFNHNTYAYYYLEVTNASIQEDSAKEIEADNYGVSYKKTVASKEYVYDRRVAIPVNFPAAQESKYAGYTYAGYNTVDNSTSMSTNFPQESDSNTTYFLFNNANEYDVTLMSNNKVVGVGMDTEGKTYVYETSEDYTYKVKYGEDLSGYIFPSLSDDADTFGPAYYYNYLGWYEDPSAEVKFNSNITMPSNNLIAYAGWDLSKPFDVIFNANAEGVADPATQIIYPGDKATDPGTLTRDGYIHVGWVDENGKIFNFETALYKETKLTAIWKSEDEVGYQLHYNLNVANSNGLLDPDKYKEEGSDVSTNTEHFESGDYEDLWTIEEAFDDLGKDVYSKFICWNTAADGSGTSYYPDDKIYIEGGTKVILYAIWAHENESTLVLVHNYPEGYTGGTKDDIITKSNLTEIDLAEIAEGSGMTYHTEIIVGEGGDATTYRFDGWSTTNLNGEDPTADDVIVAADATVKVDTLEAVSNNVNYLYAVWVQVHNITVTKEVVNKSVNYEVPEDQSFTFEWEFEDVEGNTNTNEESITLTNGESFVIKGVASGEKVTITETSIEGFTTSYNGAHIDVEDDENGICTFTMDKNSQEITVTNTVKTITVTVAKVWYDGDTDHSTDNVTAIVKENGEIIGEISLNANNNWTSSMENLYAGNSQYTIEESNVPNGYNSVITGDVENGFTITNTRAGNADITVTKVWDDCDDQDGIRPSSVTVALRGTMQTGQMIDKSHTLLASEDWTYTWEDQSLYDENGNSIIYSITETSVADKNGNTTTYTANVSGNVEEGFKVTNSYTPELYNEDGNITVTKIWSDNDNQDGKRDSYTITLTGKVGEEEVYSYSKTLEADTVTYTWGKLPKNYRGETIAYSVVETYVPEGYEASYSDLINGELTITNTHEPEQFNDKPDDPNDPNYPGVGNLTVIKIWDDNNNMFYTRPDMITVQLFADNEAVTTAEGDQAPQPVMIELTPESDDIDEWTGTFEGLNLPKYSNGKPIEYSVKEVIDDSDNWAKYYTLTSSSVSENGSITLTNKLNLDFSSMMDPNIEEEIVPDKDNYNSWIEQESVNEYDAIQVEMSTTLPSIPGDILRNDSNDESEDFILTFYNKLATGLILDIPDEGFEVDIIKADGSTKHLESGSRTYEVMINDSDAAKPISTLSAEDIPEDSTFQVNVYLSSLYNDEVIDDNDLGNATIRVFFFEDLESTDVNRSYTSTAWYQITYGDTDLFTSDPVTVAIYTFEVIVDKYDTDTNEPLADATFGIYYNADCTNAVTRNGEEYKATTDENGQAMFIGIAEGTYYVKELEAPDGYSLVEEPLTVTLEGSEDSDHIVEVSMGNTPVVNGETTSVSGSKKWVGDDALDRPDYITITLYQNGTEYKTLAVSNADGWEWTFDNLPKYNESGTAYEYTTEEETVEGYYEPVKAGNNFTNVLRDDNNGNRGGSGGGSTGSLTVALTVTGDNADNNRSFSFTVRLGDTSINGTYGEMTFSNGVATFSLKGGETMTATGLPSGISYRVMESNTSGYTVTSTGASGSISANNNTVASFTNSSSSSSGSSGGHRGSSGGGSGSSTPSGTTTGSDSGPGVTDDGISDGWSWADLGYVQDEDGNWVLAKTGESNALPIAMATGLTAALTLIVLFWMRRRKDA